MDILFKEYSAENVRKEIKFHSNLFIGEFVDSITLEDGVSWLHIDIRNGNAGVNSFKP